MSTPNSRLPAAAAEHRSLTRRHFLTMAAAGVISTETLNYLPAQPVESMDATNEPGYLTTDADFIPVERGDPLPYTLPPEKLRETMMTRDTWKLEVLPDIATGAKVENSLSLSLGTAIDWRQLMQIAETKAVRYLKVMTCNNINVPLGMGLWEGVPLREIIWLTRPRSDIRRVYYYGHHNEDPKQMFRGSLPIGRVLEDPPGLYPGLLCYKLNGQYLSGKRGGPVRIMAPEFYGYKSVKWLQRVVLTNEAGANDTYAEWNNDVDSFMKSFARIVAHPDKVRAGVHIPLSGIAQAGVSGVSRVQVLATHSGKSALQGDPFFNRERWEDAAILAPPVDWGGGLPGGKMPASTLGFTGSPPRPTSWPMRFTMVHWAAALPALEPGKYDIRCRTVDFNGIAQPMPRPFGQSGMNALDVVQIEVSA